MPILYKQQFTADQRITENGEGEWNESKRQVGADIYTSIGYLLAAEMAKMTTLQSQCKL